MIQADKQPRFQVCHQEMLVNIVLTSGDVLQEKRLLEKAATMKKKNEYLALGAELKKQPCNVKDQHKFFQNQIIVINDNREDGVETENGEITNNLYHSHVYDEKKDLINNILTYGLRDKASI